MQGTYTGDDLVRMPAAAGDEIAEAGTSELPQCRIGGETPGSTRMVRRPVQLVPHIVRVDQVARVMLHGGAVMLRARHERVSTVVGNIEPLVTVRGPGIRELGAGQ